MGRTSSALFCNVTVSNARKVVISGFSLHNDSKLSLQAVPTDVVGRFGSRHPCSLIVLRCKLGITARHNCGCSGCRGKLLATVRRLGRYFPRTNFLLLDMNSHSCGASAKRLHAVPKIGGLVHCRRGVTTRDNVTF